MGPEGKVRTDRSGTDRRVGLASGLGPKVGKTGFVVKNNKSVFQGNKAVILRETIAKAGKRRNPIVLHELSKNLANKGIYNWFQFFMS